MATADVPLTPWVALRTEGAPAALRQRLGEALRAERAAASNADQLAAAAQHLLSEVEEHPGDRGIALDLLTADALITLALLAQAEAAPAALSDFAAGLLAAERIG